MDTKPLIIQSDRTIYLEVNTPGFTEARDGLGAFAELTKCPEHIHTYTITPLSLWNAASAGVKANQIIDFLKSHTRYPVPANVEMDIVELMSRYGRLILDRPPQATETGTEAGQAEVKTPEYLILRSTHPTLLEEIAAHEKIGKMVQLISPTEAWIDSLNRGRLKQALLKLGHPVKDLAGYVEGTPLGITMRDTCLSGKSFTLRHYQTDAVSAFYRGGSWEGGSGVVVLPCGAGKTVVGIGVMAEMQCHTLILVTNVVALHQWLREILDKTTLTEDMVVEYSSENKSIGPITIATYQIMTYRKRKPRKNKDDEDQTEASPAEEELTEGPISADQWPHMSLFNARNWGLIVYDEVHLLPAPVFRMTADIQARRRLGLTATLVREDGHEDDVFSLIGPKCYDVPWKVLEEQGWIAQAICHEIRIPLASEVRRSYITAQPRRQFRVASENPDKLVVVRDLIRKNQGRQILVIGQYLDQLHIISQMLHIPVITGQMPNRERENLYYKFRMGGINVLVVSKVANFAVDLPEAEIAIQVSGTFGSRQEEAQRLGRILRPKSDGAIAHFYSLVSGDTCEAEFAQKRQLFLTEQGYRYEILEAQHLHNVNAVEYTGREAV